MLEHCFLYSRSKDGVPIAPEPRRRLKINKNIVQLTLDDVKKNDAGVYKIIAKSDHGLASRDIELRVRSELEAKCDEEPPAFLRRLSDLSVKVGTRTRFLVEINSCSNLTVSVLFIWYYNCFVLIFYAVFS